MKKILWTLTVLFIFRVIGQIAVAMHDVSFLPPFANWHSGIMPYSYLLVAQILIIGLMITMSLHVTKQKGYFAKANYWFRKPLLIFAIVYFLVMIVRYIVFGISIMVVFHWVLALFLCMFAYYHIAYVSHH